MHEENKMGITLKIYVFDKWKLWSYTVESGVSQEIIVYVYSIRETFFYVIYKYIGL